MHLFVKILSWTIALLTLAVVALMAVIALDKRPLVPSDAPLSKAERAWVKGWIASNRPSARHDEGLRTLTVDARELTLLLSDFVEKIGDGRGSARLEDGRVALAASLRLPFDQVQSYLNIELTLVEDGQLAKVESARIAGLPVPSALVETLAERTIEAVDRSQLVHDVEISEEGIEVTYEWRPHMMEQIGSRMVSEEELRRILDYQEQLQGIAASPKRRGPLSLSELLSELLGRAQLDPDPTAANRAVIMALAAYVNGRVISDPAAERSDAGRIRPRVVVLRGRRDLGQHFMTSAALSIQSDDALSSLVGWYKEMSDSDGGSGFSFVDMTANRAGIRFAELATQSTSSARRIQAFASKGLVEADFMPVIEGLPEGMSRDAFKRGFGDPKARDYQRVVSHIDRRINASRLFQLPSS